MTLLELNQEESGYISKVKGRGAFRKRIMEMGFVVGQKITVMRKAPLRDPIEYFVMGYNVSLRKSEADLIEVIKEGEDVHIEENSFLGVIDSEDIKHGDIRKDKVINVAFIGNPNSGKTTLFNFASGSRERVGNYSGVTVDAKIAKLRHEDYLINIIDLPGTYSLTTFSPEELFVRNYIFEKIPDVVVNIVDASNLERNLYLTTQLIDMDIKVVIALNMYDELIAKGDIFDYQSLGKMIGVPIIPTVGSKGKGINTLFNKIIEVYEDRDPNVRHVHINYGDTIEGAIKVLQGILKIDNNKALTNIIAPRFLAIKLLEQDSETIRKCKHCVNFEEISKAAKVQTEKIENLYKENSETIITDAKFGFISGALKETIKPGVHERRKRAEIVDTFLTHKIWGFPVFIFFLWLMFVSTFKVGQYPMLWIEGFVEIIGSMIGKLMPEGMLKDLIIDGIIGGVGGVIVFLPNILILFIFISLMEDTGYMARAAFIMDKLMHKIGLHGKSFIPLIMGFGCNVPAIMSTRILENRNERLLTMLINPFMSCSARLPVYVLFIGAFFPEYPGTMLFMIYAIGIMIAILVALLFNKTLFKNKEAPFVMELPPYRYPTVKATIKNMWGKAEQYLRKMGGIILIASILIWALGYFPREIEFSGNYTTLIQQENQKKSQEIDNTIDPTQIIIIEKKYSDKIIQIENEQDLERQEKSYIGKMGHFIEPVIEPLGFDWRMGVSLLTGMAAKEIVVSTIGVLYQSGIGNNKVSESLTTKLQTQTYKEGKKRGQKVFSPLVAFGFMMFVLIYFPCIAVLVAVKKESGSWKWGVFMGLYTTTLAWIVSFLIYQVGSLF
ncbi:MAG: ferrous iron transport protein B [Bacteroidales bacterium]|nr:ferrous iron transport protein B [Bacteroidales bacterium]